VISALLEHVRPVLAEQGEQDLAGRLWSDLLGRGTGAQEQRSWAGEDLADVLLHATDATLQRPPSRIMPS
jgi:hypothetical protein